MSTSPIQPLFVSVKEAARILDLTTWSVYKLLDAQVIKSQYQGRKRSVRLDSLTEYADGLPIVAPEPDAS